MRRQVSTLGAALAILLTAGAGTALAGSPTQSADQFAGNAQAAESNATSTQVDPSNENISVRIFSPGDDGEVSQANVSVAAAAAANQNATDQSAEQQQAGGGGGVQAASQGALNEQAAKADATSEQIHPSNSNISVRIHSPGDNGDVKQLNHSAAGALAANENGTTQDAAQKQGGGGKCCDGGGSAVQWAAQKAISEHAAQSDATSKQVHPSNSNTPVRIHSSGDGGDVQQLNASEALSLAANENETDQHAGQDQAGSRDCKCGGGAAVQALGQFAASGQAAKADASSEQFGAGNSNAPVRIKSEGSDGDVRQANLSAALAAALNHNSTDQSAKQEQAGGGDCKCGGGGARVQALGQLGLNYQAAEADADSKQIKPSNENSPVRDAGHGDGGSVWQANASLAAALGLNANQLSQDATQRQA